jgi:excisionase family DNA binding protein
MKKKIAQGLAALLDSEGSKDEAVAHVTPSSALFEKLVWTVSDVCEYLACSERHVRQLVAENRIPHANVGRLVRFSRDRVVTWFLNGGTQS